MEANTQERPKPKIVRTLHYECAFVTVIAVLIIFLVILQKAEKNWLAIQKSQT